MTSAFNPPKTLSQDDVKRIADLRRDVWKAGFMGAAGGLVAGYSGWHVLKKRLPAKLRGPNNAMLATLGTGALLSFLCSLAAGKNSIQRVGDVFRRGAHEWKKKKDDPLSEPALSRYQQITLENQKARDSGAGFEKRKIALDARKRDGGGFQLEEPNLSFEPPPSSPPPPTTN